MVMMMMMMINKSTLTFLYTLILFTIRSTSESNKNVTS